MSSNRLWGSIPKVPDRYPRTSAYYRRLFSPDTSFRLAAKFTSYPGIPIFFFTKCLYLGKTDYPIAQNSFIEYSGCQHPGIYFRDDSAEESFTVYDHPQVLIYKNQKNNYQNF
jgi:hypothetical protein